MSKKMVEVVKQALREVEYEDWHNKIHDRVRAKLSRDTPLGKVGFAKCGECDMIFQAATPTPLSKQEEQDNG